MSCPAKAHFFCDACVSNEIVKSDVWGDPMPCDVCGNNRIITPFEYITELTRDFVKVERFATIEEGTYYVMLVTDVKLYDNVLDDFSESTDIVRGSRFIKDRFFFSTPLEDHIRVDQFFKVLTWTPKR